MARRFQDLLESFDDKGMCRGGASVDATVNLQDVKRLLARRLHPDSFPSTHPDYSVRSAIFAELWPEIERLSRRDARVQASSRVDRSPTA